MNKKFIFSIITVILILFAVTGITWVLVQKNTVPPAQIKNSVEYVNNQYGFNVTLPQDWKGYTIVTGTWEGQANGNWRGAGLEGVEISLRNPLWTEQKPYQDIPIMVFAKDQWSNLQQGNFHIGAAPINPSELGANGFYVFALPARYNYAYPIGWQEVDKILQGKPLETFAPINSAPNTVPAVHIDFISPVSAPNGTKVTISGSGFNTSNTILFDNLVAVSDAQLSSFTNGNQSISFTVPSSLAPDCKTGQACPMFLRQVTPGNYSVSVENQNGTSNALNFKVTTSTDTVTRKVGDKEFNFLIQKINTNSVDGLWYVLYPVAMSQGQPKTLKAGDTVGYACEGKTATLTNIDVAHQAVTFNEVIQNAPLGGCPI